MPKNFSGSIRQWGRATFYRLAGGLGLTLLLAGAATADEVIVGTQRLSIDPPAGYCVLDRHNPIEADVLEGIEELYALPQNNALLIAYFVSCHSLELFRSGQQDELRKHQVSFVVNTYGGKVPLVEQPRDKFLERLALTLSNSVVNAEVAQYLNRAVDLIRNRVENGAIQIGEERWLGLIGRDETAVYVGSLRTVSISGQTHVVLYVTGITLVRGVPLSVAFGSIFVDADTYEQLREKARHAVRDLLVANGGFSN